MVDVDPVNRLDAKEAKDRLGTIVYSMAPESLLIRPNVVSHDSWYPASSYFLKLRLYQL